MTDPPRPFPVRDPGLAGSRLDSWKEIAAYLGRDVRTAQRWEKTEGLPIHRLQHAKRGSVYTFRSELDEWWQGRKARLAAEPDEADGGNATSSGKQQPATYALLGHRTVPWIRIGVLGLLIAAASAGWFLRDGVSIFGPRMVTFADFPGNVSMPAFSPDGATVAFVWNRSAQDNTDIYIKRIGSTDLQPFVASPLDDFSPAWSPDGNSIAFLRKGRTSTLLSLYVAPVSGGPPRKILDAPGFTYDSVATLEWTPDGNWLIGPARESPEEPFGLFLISPSDGTKSRLTLPPAGQTDAEPALSPDGRALAFTRRHADNVTSIFVVPVSREFLPTAEPRLIPTFPNLRIRSPQWAPDGKSLIFAATRNGATIWRVRLIDDRARVGAPESVRVAEHSAWAWIGRPRAGRLMVSVGYDDFSIRKVPLQASASRAAFPCVGSCTGRNAAPEISPDGARIAFETDVSGAREIAVANIDGSHPRQLTFFGGPNTGSPAWSPDGRWIVFDSRAEGRPQIYVLPAEGGQPRRLTTTLADNNVPAWSHDAKWIYYVSTRSGAQDIWRQPANGGEAEQVTHDGSWPQESPDGRALYYQRSGPAGWNLWRLDLTTGQDAGILQGMLRRAFAVVREGAYYIPEPALDKENTIQFFDFRTGDSRVVAPIGRPLSRPLAVAPDGSFLMYSQVDRTGQSLMLVNNFR